MAVRIAKRDFFHGKAQKILNYPPIKLKIIYERNLMTA